MLDWNTLPGMIKSGRVKCVGHGDHFDDEDCCMWTLIEVDGQKVLVLEQWHKGECESTEVSSNTDFTKDEMVALSEAAGDMDRNNSPEMAHRHCW